jgi:ABC-type Fe3+/spermidine/putrescine transport system ATPase subunit
LGTPQQLYREPASVNVRDFVGRTIVLDGIVDEIRADGTVVRLGDAATVTCRGATTQGLSAGAHAQIAIRPEQARVEAADSPDSGPNRMVGIIDALLFIGDHYEATLSLDIGQTVMAHLQATDTWREGQRVALSMRPEDVRVWGL